MSKKSYKSQASSSRASASTFGTQVGSNSIGTLGASSTLGALTSSPLSYVYEPPDLSTISEPTVVVILKNLQKKDAVTKFKALEELQAHVLLAGTEESRVEESILEAWVKLYPRTSIDSARQVRRLAHLVQGQISVSFGKRVARYMQQIIGTWLAGLYDNDRSVARAALDSLKQVFPSEEKMKGVWRVYLPSLVQFAIDAITRETPTTLSDERTTKPDDASAKYARVVGTMIFMVTNAIDETSIQNHIKEGSIIQVFLREHKVWDFAADPDPFVRRSVYRLAVVAASKVKESLDPSLIGATMLKKTLSIPQMGSAFDYATALMTLTSEMPEIWSHLDKLSTKKSAYQRLCDFLKKGSQAGPPEYWDQIANLMKQLPHEVLMTASGRGSVENIATFPVLEALHEGLMSSDEPRGNQISAWSTYLDTVALFVSSAPGQTGRDDIARQSLVPIVEQYVKPSLDEARWTLGGPKTEDVCVRAIQMAFSTSSEVLQETWSCLSHEIVKDFEKNSSDRPIDDLNSESVICACVIRWNNLQTAVFRSAVSNSLKHLISKSVISELNEALHILEESAGENVTAALLLKSALKMPPDVFRTEHNIMTAITSFARHYIPKLLLSRSATHLIEILILLTDVIDINPLCEAGTIALRGASDSAAKSVALQSFAESRFLAQGNEANVLKIVIKDYLESALEGEKSKWELILAAMGNPAAPRDLIDDMFGRMTASLSIEDERLPSLHGLELVINQKGQVVKALVNFSGSLRLLSKLLLLAESTHDDLAYKARDISIEMEFCLTAEKGSSYAVESMIEIIKKGLDMAGPELFSINSLVQYAHKLLDQSLPTSKASLVTALLPDSTQWARIITPLLRRPPPLSFSHISPLGGAIKFVNSEEPLLTYFDAIDDDFSLAYRTARYTAKFIQNSSLIDITLSDRVMIVKNLVLFHQVATHSFFLPKLKSLTEHENTSRASGTRDFIFDLDSVVKFCNEEDLTTGLSFLPTVKQQLLSDCRGISPASYYSACAFLFLELRYNKPLRSDDLYLKTEQAESLDKPSDIFRTIATLMIAADTTLLLRKVNEVLAELIGYEFGSKSDIVLHQLVLLNCILSTKASALITQIPKQRLVLFVKHSINQIHRGKLSRKVTEELLMALSVSIPSIKDVYDSFWEQLIDFINNTLSPANQFLDDDNIPLFHATLKLFASLNSLVLANSNDDLEDAWAEKVTSLYNKLLDLFKECQGVSDDHAPRHRVASLLAQQLLSSPQNLIGELTELYGLLASRSTEVQVAAYSLLHYQIPNAQGQVSLDKALEKDFKAKLPDELLSLVVAAPSSHIYGAADFANSGIGPLYSYLLSWKLIFDHWTNSSEKTKADYAADLKEGSCLESLLEFTFRILISNRSKPLNVSSFEKSSFTPCASKNVETEALTLLVHLYYLSLKCVPSLCRIWWRDTSSRQTAIAVEMWTEKYISPMVITSELEAISAWASSQSTAEQPMEIKVSLSTREVTASIPIDEQALQIAIRLPPSYPLARPSVESLHRVAVDEKKWRGWLIATQGIINFTADGGQPVMEGLLAWRRNVTATLKGQTECAICYSVVGGDRQLPSKRCGTCKNCFHGSCLFKWFKSSNSSSCPLCRNAFNYA